MQRSTIFEPKIARFGINMLIFILICITIIPVLTPSLAQQEEKEMLMTMISHNKIIPNSINNFFTHQRLKALTLIDEMFQASFRQIRDSDNVKNNYYYYYYYYYSNNNTTNSKPKKMLHRSFRIPEDILKALENEATSEEIPLSNLVNRILRNYLVTQLRSENNDFILTKKDFFRRVFAKIDGERSIQDYGKELGYAVVSEYTSAFFPEITSHTLIQFLRSWFNRFQSYQHRIDEGNNRHTFSLNHDINMNFSMILKVILQGLIEPVTKSSVVFAELTSTSITLTFEI
jgi:hypothetical protein